MISNFCKMSKQAKACIPQTSGWIFLSVESLHGVSVSFEMMFLMNRERMNVFKVKPDVYINTSELLCSSRPLLSVETVLAQFLTICHVKTCLEGHRSFLRWTHWLWCLLWFNITLLFCELMLNGSSCLQLLMEISVCERMKT